MMKQKKKLLAEPVPLWNQAGFSSCLFREQMRLIAVCGNLGGIGGATVVKPLTIMSLVQPVPHFGTIPPPETPNIAHREKKPSKVTASQADIYLNMNRACFLVFLARVGQKVTNVRRDGSTKDNILNFPNLVHLSS